MIDRHVIISKEAMLYRHVIIIRRLCSISYSRHVIDIVPACLYPITAVSPAVHVMILIAYCIHTELCSSSVGLMPCYATLMYTMLYTALLV